MNHTIRWFSRPKFHILKLQAPIHTGFHSFTEIGQHICFSEKKNIKIYIKNAYKKTSNNHRLRSAGDNDRRSKRFRSIAVLCAGKFHVAESQTTRDQINSR